MPVDINELKGKAEEYLRSDNFKDLLPYLLSGGAGAVAGGFMTGRRRKKKGEGRLGYLGRVLRNALVAGGLAGGAHYLVNKGVESTVGGLAEDNAVSGGPDNEGPLTTTTKNILFSPVTAAVSGGVGLATTRKLPFIGAGDSRTAARLKRFGGENPVVTGAGKKMKSVERTAEDLLGLDADEIANLGGSSERTRRLAGLPSTKIESGTVGSIFNYIPWLKETAKGETLSRAEKLKGALSTLSRRHVSTFGQTYPIRARRGAIGLAAAGIPALIGAMVTDKAE